MPLLRNFTPSLCRLITWPVVFLSACLARPTAAGEAALYTAPVLYGDLGGMKVEAQGDVIVFMAAKNWRDAALENKACAYDLHCTMQKNNKGMVIISPEGLWIVDRPSPSITLVSTAAVQPGVTLTTLNTGIPAIDESRSVQLVNSSTLQWLAETINAVSTTTVMDSLGFDEALSPVIEPSSSQGNQLLTRITEDDYGHSSHWLSTTPVPTPQITRIENRMLEAGLVHITVDGDLLTIRPSPSHPHNNGSGITGSFTFTTRQVPTDSETQSNPNTATLTEPAQSGSPINPSQTPAPDDQLLDSFTLRAKRRKLASEALDEPETRVQKSGADNSFSESQGATIDEYPGNIPDAAEISSDEEAESASDPIARPLKEISPELNRLAYMAIERCDYRTIGTLLILRQEFGITAHHIADFLLFALSSHRCDYDHKQAFDASYLRDVAKHIFHLSGLEHTRLVVYQSFIQDEAQGVRYIALKKNGLLKARVYLRDWCLAKRQCVEFLSFFLRHISSPDSDYMHQYGIEILDHVMQTCWNRHMDIQKAVIDDLSPAIQWDEHLSSSRLARYFRQVLLNIADPGGTQGSYNILILPRLLDYGLDYQILTGCSKTSIVRLLIDCTNMGDPRAICTVALSHPEESLLLPIVPDLFLGQSINHFHQMYRLREQALQYFIEGGGDLNSLTWKDKPLLNMFIDHADHWHYCSTGLKHLVSYGLVPVFIQPPECLRRSGFLGPAYEMQYLLNEIKNIQVRLYRHKTLTYLCLSCIFSNLRRPVRLEDLSLPGHIFQKSFKEVLDQLNEEAGTQPFVYTLDAPALSFPYETSAAAGPSSQEPTESRSIAASITHFFQGLFRYFRGE